MRRLVFLMLLTGGLLPAQAVDTMTLGNGQVLKGRFMGYADRKFEFKTASGTVVSEFPVNVKSITPEAPLKVTVDLANKHYEDIDFRSFDEFTLRFTKDERNVDERVILLKQLVVNRPPEKPSIVEPPADVNENATPRDGVRNWKRENKWREIESKNSKLISSGEEVEIEDFLKPGYINIVHFHYPKSLTSVREGNYVEALAAKPSGRMVVLKIRAGDFNAPICGKFEIKSMPQFWFYDTHGRLVKKLTDRFTEGDIDEAIRMSRRGVLRRSDDP